jgi:hypothetical protein
METTRGIQAERAVRAKWRSINADRAELQRFQQPFPTFGPEFNAMLHHLFVAPQLRAWLRANGPAREAEARSR